MKYQEQLLAILEQNRGTYLSGELLARKLFISRNTVWKTMKALQAQGYPIDAVTNKGYALAAHSDVLSSPAIAAKMRHKERVQISVLQSVTSTNTCLKAEALKGAAEGTLLVALSQSAGKGRLGRSFVSPANSGVYMSLLLRPKMAAKDALMLTTAIAVAAAQTIRHLTNLPVGIKWVNDLFLDGKKICGILTEAAVDFESQGLEYAVVGIGINLELPEDGFDESIKDVAGSLFEKGKTPPGFRAALIAGIIDRFLDSYDHLEEKPFLGAYRELSCILGKPVRVVDNIYAPGSFRDATALSIDDQCRLLVQFPDGEQKALSSGEVSIRPAQTKIFKT